MVNSRNKGKAGELELAHELTRILGCEARRGQQFSGSPDSPDVMTNLPGLHIECKRVERFNLYDALAQSAQNFFSNFWVKATASAVLTVTGRQHAVLFLCFVLQKFRVM